jgi:hypothetical protein
MRQRPDTGNRREPVLRDIVLPNKKAARTDVN